MSKNFIQPGDTIDVVVPAGGVTSGVGVLIGSMFGVAAVTALETETAAVHLEGVFELTKLAGEAWTQGAAIYWDDGSKKCTSATTSSNAKIGVAAEAAGSAAVLGKVRLNGSF